MSLIHQLIHSTFSSHHAKPLASPPPVLKGASGAQAPEPGAADEQRETLRQSGQPQHKVNSHPRGGTTQLRIRLPHAHARRLLALKPSERQQAAAIIFGAYSQHLDLRQLLTAVTELRAIRLTLIALSSQHPQANDPAGQQLTQLLDRIQSLLGGAP